MSFEEMEGTSPQMGVTPVICAKGLWALGGLTVSTAVGHSTGHSADAKRWVEAVVKPGSRGAYVLQHLNLSPSGKVHGKQARASNRTWEIWLSGLIGGPPESWPWWK